MEKRAKSKQQNKGFTLVEVIIAVAILGIAFSPLLANLVQSARINGKSRRTMDATNMAQNLMEGLNAYSSDDIIKGFDTRRDGEALAILPTGMACAEYGEVSDGTTINYTNTATGVSGTPKYCAVSSNSVSGNVATKIIRSDDDKYIFYLKDVDGATYTDYDVKVTMDASQYHKENDTDPDKYNDVEVANVASTNKMFDAVWTDKYDDFPHISKDIQAGAIKDVFKYTKRKLEIVIENKGTNAKPDYVVTGIDNYYYNPGGYTFSDSDLEYTNSSVMYDMANTGQTPRNVYVYYWPNYKTDLEHNESRRDDFIVTNKTDLPIKVYLVRMVVPKTTVTLKTDNSNEAGYYINVRVTDTKGKNTNINGVSAANKASVEEFTESNTCVYTNMRENITQTHQANAEKVAAGEKLNKDFYNYMRVKVFYRLPVSGQTDKFTDGIEVTNQDHRSLLVRDLADEKAKERIYTMKLEVYEKGSADAGFPEDKRVAVFTGGTIQ